MSMFLQYYTSSNILDQTCKSASQNKQLSYGQVSYGFGDELILFRKLKKKNQSFGSSSRENFYDTYSTRVNSEWLFNTPGEVVNNLFTT